MAGRRFAKAKPIAAPLGICTRTLFRWADAGMIARHKINAGVVLFDEAEVTALIDFTRTAASALAFIWRQLSHSLSIAYHRR